MNDAERPAQINSRRPGAPGAATLVIALAVLAPLVYVLSIGPVVAVANKAGYDLEALAGFYAPVVWLHDHTALKEPLEWYADLWGWK